MAQKCPKCGLFNPEIALRCDCGYDFESRTMQKSFVPPPTPEQKRRAGKDRMLAGAVAFLFSSALLIWKIAEAGSGEGVTFRTVWLGLGMVAGAFFFVTGLRRYRADGIVRPTWLDPFDERQDVAARPADRQAAAAAALPLMETGARVLRDEVRRGLDHLKAVQDESQLKLVEAAPTRADTMTEINKQGIDELQQFLGFCLLQDWDIVASTADGAIMKWVAEWQIDPARLSHLADLIDAYAAKAVEDGVDDATLERRLNRELWVEYLPSADGLTAHAWLLHVAQMLRMAAAAGT
jgi:hypothetical protein